MIKNEIRNLSNSTLYEIKYIMISKMIYTLNHWHEGSNSLYFTLAINFLYTWRYFFVDRWLSNFSINNLYLNSIEVLKLFMILDIEHSGKFLLKAINSFNIYLNELNLKWLGLSCCWCFSLKFDQSLLIYLHLVRIV